MKLLKFPNIVAVVPRILNQVIYNNKRVLCCVYMVYSCFNICITHIQSVVTHAVIRLIELIK